MEGPQKVHDAGAVPQPPVPSAAHSRPWSPHILSASKHARGLAIQMPPRSPGAPAPTLYGLLDARLELGLPVFSRTLGWCTPVAAFSI